MDKFKCNSIQSGPYHIGLWNYEENNLDEFMSVDAGINSINYESSTNSIVYVSGNETLVWIDLVNHTTTKIEQAKDFMFHMGS